MIKKFPLLARILLFVLFPYMASAEQSDLEQILPPLPDGVVESLISNTEVFRYDRSMSGLKLIPIHPSLAVVKNKHREFASDVMVEGLYLIPYPEGAGGIDLNLYNITRSVSAISEVKYYSARRKAIVPLFDKVYRISDMQKKKALSDPIVETIPMYESILMHMKEVNLGTGYYETQYVYDGESLGIFFKNVSPLRSLIKIVDRENMLIDIVILPSDRGYLVYGYCAVKFTFRNLVFNMMDPYSAFYKRLYAMVTWVNNSLHGSNKDPIIGQELDF